MCENQGDSKYIMGSINVDKCKCMLKQVKRLDKGVFDVVSLQRISKNLCFNE